jgi:peptidyl-prolyl cis-trans isomerase D
MSQKRDFAYTIIPSSQYRKEISADLLKQYYEQHKQDFKAPAKMRIEYIELSLAASAKNMTVSQHELNDYFGSNGNLAKNDPKVIAKAKETLLQQKAEQAFLAASDKLADLTYTDPNSLTQAANALGLTIATTDYFTQAGGTTPLTKNPKIIATVYNPDFIKNNVNSNLIELAPGVVAVVRLKDYQADSVLPLPAVQNKIKQQLIAANATIAAKQQGEALLMSIKGGDDFAKQVSRVKGLTIATKIQVSRKQADLSPELLSLAFSIGPQAKTKLVGAQLTNGDYAIVLLKNTQAQSQIKSDSKMNVEKTYPENYGKVDYQFYTANQIEQSKIKTYSK